MKIVFRWYGENDSITLEKIRQIPVVEGVVTAVYDVKVGEVWPVETIQRLVNKSEENALSCKVIESVPVHEEIKLGGKDAEKYIEKTKLILEIHSRGLREKDFSLSQLHELQNYLERTEK